MILVSLLSSIGTCTFTLLISTTSAQGLLAPLAIKPASAVVSTTSVAGSPWFDYETIQLTEEVLNRIKEEDATRSYASFYTDGSSSIGRNDPSLGPGACKTFPGDENWPAAADWGVFNDLLGGALIPTIPIAAPCYKNWGLYNSTRCAEIVANFHNPYVQ